MTYSNKRTHKSHLGGHQSPSPFNTNPAQSNDAYFAALAPAFRAVVVLGYSLLSRLCGQFEDSLRYNCDHNTKKFKIAMSAMILFMIVIPGTRAEKTEFLHRLFEKLYAKRNARLKELRAEYIVWRQRKCWMWAGGFRGAPLARVTDVFAGAEDETSFDALIPDW